MPRHPGKTRYERSIRSTSPEDSAAIVAAARERKARREPHSATDDLARAHHQSGKPYNYKILPYIDPHDHTSLASLVQDWRLANARIAKANKLIQPLEMTLVVAFPPPSNPLKHFVLCNTTTKNLGANIINFPGGKFEPGENELTCACRELREETGLRLLAPKAVGVLLPTQAETEDLMHPWIVHVVTGNALSNDKAIRPPKEKSTPYVTPFHNLADIRAVASVQLIASLVTGPPCHFAIESETMAAPNTSRVTLYRPEDFRPQQLTEMEYGQYPP